MKTFSMTTGQKSNFNQANVNIAGIGCPDTKSNVTSMCYVKIQGVYRCLETLVSRIDYVQALINELISHFCDHRIASDYRERRKGTLQAHK